MTRLPLDPTLSSLFRMEWLAALDATTRDDHTRAVAERAEAILRGALFVQENRGAADVEVRVWVEGACGSACVSITWEPGPARFGVHLLDESLRERLACVVFETLPCVTASQSASQLDSLLEALRLVERR
jgi:hypothetical protein